METRLQNQHLFRPKFLVLTLIAGLMAGGHLFAQKFTDVSLDAGIDLVIPEKRISGGIAVFDYNNDGWEDMYFSCAGTADRLYKNNGDGTFSDVTVEAGLQLTATPIHTTGVVAGDIDNDGFRDLFVTVERSHDRDQLFRNNGDGTFTNITVGAGMLADSSAGNVAAMADFNNDGFLDIYVGNRLDTSNLSYDNNGVVTGYAHTCKANNLYLNNGDLTFTEVGMAWGVGDKGCANVVSVTDFDNDNDMDIMVGNDFGMFVLPNALYRNNYPDPGFTDISVSSGVDQGMFTMGYAVGDYDHDMDLDYYVTNMGRNSMLKNNNDETFTDVADFTGVHNTWIDELEGTVTTGWGSGFLDVDNNTWQDLYVVNGYVGVPWPVPAPNRVRDPDKFFYNNGNGVFVDKTEEYGLGHDRNRPRGFVYVDYNNDGKMDMVVSVMDDRPDIEEHTLLYRNDLVNSNNYLKIKLEGVVSNRDAIGAHLSIYLPDGKSWVYEVDGGSSWLSQPTSIAHFGLGENTLVDSVVIDWPLGIRQTLKNIPVNQFLQVREDTTTGPDTPPTSVRTIVGPEEGLRVYPNPFSDNTRVQFTLAQAQNIELGVYDKLGREVQRITNGFRPAGANEVVLNNEVLTPGIYVIRLVGEHSRFTHKVVVR